MFEYVGIESLENNINILASIPFPKKSKWHWWNISNRLSSTWETWIICVYHVNKRSGLIIQYFLNGTSQKHGSHMLHARIQINASHISDAFYFPNVSLHVPTKSILEISNLMDDNPQQKKRLVWYQNSTSTIIYRSNLYIIKLYISHDMSTIFINFPHRSYMFHQKKNNHPPGRSARLGSANARPNSDCAARRRARSGGLPGLRALTCTVEWPGLEVEPSNF